MIKKVRRMKGDLEGQIFEKYFTKLFKLNGNSLIYRAILNKVL